VFAVQGHPPFSIMIGRVEWVLATPRATCRCIHQDSSSYEGALVIV
jgi:hypothetical protein